LRSRSTYPSGTPATGGELDRSASADLAPVLRVAAATSPLVTIVLAMKRMLGQADEIAQAIYLGFSSQDKLARFSLPVVEQDRKSFQISLGYLERIEIEAWVITKGILNVRQQET